MILYDTIILFNIMFFNSNDIWLYSFETSFQSA